MFYRLYFLDADGHIERARVFECEGDESARLVCREQRRRHGVELWQAERCVEALPPPAEA